MTEADLHRGSRDPGWQMDSVVGTTSISSKVVGGAFVEGTLAATVAGCNDVGKTVDEGINVERIVSGGAVDKEMVREVADVEGVPGGGSEVEGIVVGGAEVEGTVS